MAYVYPDSSCDWRIHQNTGDYLWTGRYTGTSYTHTPSAGKVTRTICIDIGIKNRDVQNGTIDVYWEFGTSSGQAPSHTFVNAYWGRLQGMGYTIGSAIKAYKTDYTGYAIESLDYDDAFSRTDDGYKVYRVAYSGKFTLKCNADGKFIIPIYGKIYAYYNGGYRTLELASQDITLPSTFDIPQIYVYNGSAWKNGTPYVYNGTNWVAGLAKVYDGTSWKP